MNMRAGVAIALLGLAAACSSGSQASPSPTAPSTTVSERRCPAFLGSDYIDKPATAGQSVPAGWFAEFRSDQASYGSNPPAGTIIAGFDRSDVNCVVTFKVTPAFTLSSSTPPPAPAGPLTTVSDGTYLVGTDMEAGSYKTSGGKGCYWARLKDDGGQNIIANNLGDGPARFTTKKGEYVEIARCTFTKV